MARLRALEPDSFDPRLKARLGEKTLASPQGLGIYRVLAQRPDLAGQVITFVHGVEASATVSRRLLELVRIRVAFHNQCRSCMALRFDNGARAGVTEDLVCSLEKPEEAPDLTEAEKAALAFADRMATDHLSIDDEIFERLRLHFTEPEIIEIGVFVAWYVGFGRLSATWDIVDDLPLRFHDRAQKVTPWGARDAVAVGNR